MMSFHPFLPFAVAALLALVTRGWLRGAILLAAPVVGLWHLVGVEVGTSASWQIMSLELMPYRVDELSLLFGYLFHIGAFMAVLFALHVRDTLQQSMGILYAGSAVGAVFAGDLVTLFVFWEILGLSSAFLVWAARDERSIAAGIRYLIYQVASGVLLMAGLIWYGAVTGGFAFTEIGAGTPAGILILLAFGIKAGFPLVHNWITDAYPASTPTGTVFLCVFTTKVAVYALARGFPGVEALIYVGAFMACYPIFFAVIENDLRRVLGYSMINQLGFMVCGIGIGSSLALNGAVAHAFNDVFFKGLLFMAMGAVLYVTGRTKASDLGGLYRKMPITATLCIIGAITISAFPLTSAFVSKSMVMSALLDEGRWAVWLAMLFASAGVLEHAGIKIPYFAFFAHDAKLEAKEPPVNMLLAMTLAAVVCVGVGVFPSLLYDILPYDAEYDPYDLTHVLTQLQLLAFAILGVVFLHMSGRYPAEIPAVNLDIEWLWRKALPSTARLVRRAGADLAGGLKDTFGAARRGGLVFAGERGLKLALARNWPTGSMVLWVGVFLALMLLAGVLGT
ncbi:MAG TPA: Na(+)/H(+) antiporter subunit D [Gammaproteobacteria bacterium]|nr:Na(+)/H(+) antiporter subunit D [Gammaproteobacteria bacterium]